MRISDWSSDVCSSDLIDKPSSNCLVVIELRGDRACGIDQARRGVGRLVRIVEHGRILSFGPLWSGKSPPSLSPPKMAQAQRGRSEVHTSELQSLMRISYDVFSLNKKKINRAHLHSSMARRTN